MQIHTENITEDIRSVQLLSSLLESVRGNTLRRLEPYAAMLHSDNPKVKQYQKYIHNISRILNCVECEKCRLFGKMQTYGLGTALKILLGFSQPFKRNEIVALLNVFNKVTMSVCTYFDQAPLTPRFHYSRLCFYALFPALLFLTFVAQIDLRSKIKRMFRHSFPSYKKLE